MTLKEVIEDILQTEKEGRTHVEEARNRAKEMILAAEEEAKKLRRETHEKAEKEAAAFLARTETGAQKEKEIALDAANGAMASFWDDKREVIVQTVDKLFHMITGRDS